MFSVEAVGVGVTDAVGDDDALRGFAAELLTSAGFPPTNRVGLSL